MKKSNDKWNSMKIISTLLLIILVVTVSCKKDSDIPGKNEVYIPGMYFDPSNRTVDLNTTVKWTNKDNVAHTVTSNTGVFDSGSIAPGGTFTFTFSTAGTYQYHCTLHPSMTGAIFVNP